MGTKSAIAYFIQNPRTLFLLDGLGAALTTLSLLFVLRTHHDYFGMPVDILIYLSVIGLVYGLYSMSCYFLLKDRWSPYLKIIGIGNFLYCMLTVMLLHSHYNELTPMGVGYFLGEVLIIMLLVYVELRVARMLKTVR